jgi:hypothetical protein
MSEDQKENGFYLSIKHFVNESLLRDLILFCFFFLIILSQTWEEIIFLLFPIITYGFSLFFRIININKWRTEFENSSVVYNPLGLEKKHANRLFFSALFQLILIFWIGAESLYNPHLVEGYFFYFNLLFVFLFTFGFFWIFIDLWKYSRIEIIINRNNSQVPNNAEATILSFLKIHKFKIIAIVNFVVFLTLNLLNMLFVIFANQIPILGFQLKLPSSALMTVSSVIFAFLIISPLVTVVSLTINYIDINSFSKTDLDEILKSLPLNVQINITENLKALNKKIHDQLNIE